MIKIMRYGEVPNSEIFARPDESIDVSGTVSDILQDVKKRGDDAVLDYCQRFDGISKDNFNNTSYVTVNDGEYLKLTRCTGVLQSYVLNS